MVRLDEAHTLDLGVGRMLLNASQQVRANAPFLHGAGRHAGPAAAHLGAMNASFWMPLGRGPSGHRPAERRPLRLRAALVAAAGTRTAKASTLDALATVVEESQRYPYFGQLWGAALWERRLATGAPAADRRSRGRGTARRGRPRPGARTRYQERYRELETRRPAAGGRRSGAALPGRRHRVRSRHRRGPCHGPEPTAAARLAARRSIASARLHLDPARPGRVRLVVWIAGIPSRGLTHGLDHATVNPVNSRRAL